jgi:hypothetical protein
MPSTSNANVALEEEGSDTSKGKAVDGCTPPVPLHLLRHCERSEAIQSPSAERFLNCFAANDGVEA